MSASARSVEEHAMTATRCPIRPLQPATATHVAAHACAWCGRAIPTVPALLDHVVAAHLDAPLAA
jgi:hypothetical protein